MAPETKYCPGMILRRIGTDEEVLVQAINYKFAEYATAQGPLVDTQRFTTTATLVKDGRVIERGIGLYALDHLYEVVSSPPIVTPPVDELEVHKRAVEVLRKELAKVTELWMDAVNQGASRYRASERDLLFDGALSTWEEAFYELKARGLAEGNEKEGYRLKWPGSGKDGDE